MQTPASREVDREVGQVRPGQLDLVDQLARLAGLSDAVARAAGTEETCAAALDCLAQMLSPDGAAVLVLDDEGVLRCRAWRGLSEGFRRAAEGHGPWTQSTRNPVPVLVEDVDVEPSLASLGEAIEAEGIRSLGLFPFVAGERLPGTLLVFFDQPRAFTVLEARLAQAVAAHVALGLGRHQTEESIRQAAAGAAERLQTVSLVLGTAVTAAEIAAVVAREGAEALGAAAAWLAAVDDDGALRRVAARGESRAWRLLDGRRPVLAAVREQRSLWFESADDVVAAYPELDAVYRTAGFEALAIVPIVVAGRATGVVALTFTEERAFLSDERSLLLALAAQCGQGLERATLYRRLEERADAASVLAHVGDGVFKLDEAEVVGLWNRGAAVITGIDEEDALGKPISELCPDWPAIRPRISITTVPLAVGRRPALPLRIGDREFWIAISGVATRDGVVYAFRDVTEAEKLEQARRDFLATVSHELRTPLTGVFGATKTLLHREVDPATTSELLQVIDSETQRLASILDEILFASSLDAGAVGVDTERCDPVGLVREVLALERTRAPSGVTLTLDAPGDVPAILCDEAKLRQVLVNLLDNAIKYSPGGGAIVVSIVSSPEVVRISVTDHGLGIPAGEEERIFEKFYRLDPQLKRGVGGTGLGLYISREFVERMGGRIWARSLESRSSTFHVELPIAR